MNRRSLFKSLTAAIVASAIELNFVAEAVAKVAQRTCPTIDEILNEEAARLTEFWAKEILKKDISLYSLNRISVTDYTK